MSESKTLIEMIEENKKLLKAEYQRGYSDGGLNMNAKWLITRKEIISEFEEIVRIVLTEEFYLSHILTQEILKTVRKKWRGETKK